MERQMNESTPYRERMDFGKWTAHDLDALIRRSSLLKGIARRVEFISRQFLGLSYGASTLIGGVEEREVFVINLRHVDCFTFLDYVEALRLSDTISSFRDMVKQVRYQQGIVSYGERNHFFIDWADRSGASVSDVTGAVGRDVTRTYEKKLNDRGDGSLLLPGIPPRNRVISCIPAASLSGEVCRRLHAGDYVGVCSESPGLDVSHVGIVVRRRGTLMLRHASPSPAHGMVVEQGLIDYMEGKPGIIVLRPI
jgi:hypothetical protein